MLQAPTSLHSSVISSRCERMATLLGIVTEAPGHFCQCNSISWAHRMSTSSSGAYHRMMGVVLIVETATCLQNRAVLDPISILGGRILFDVKRVIKNV